MDAPRVSVVVASQRRPAELSLCLTGLSQLDWEALEVVVVGCREGCAAACAHPEGRSAKILEYPAQNISAARNLGIAAAAGDVIAFIDDDAVPEPSWLRHLVAPFHEPRVAAAGGCVLGRNGISVQWGPRSVDRSGTAHPLDLADDAPVVLSGTPEHAIKTEGTNMAVRRNALADMGGFDPAFRFYLDETDVNMRLALADHATAFVPRARVHHAFARSDRRARDRTPRDLHEIGASTAVFLRKHAPEADHARHLAAFRAAQRMRLLSGMQRGPLDPLDVVELLRGLARGMEDGLARPLAPLYPLPRPEQGFAPYPTRPGARIMALAGRRAAPLRAEAARRVAAGEVVTVFRFSPTTFYHKLHFRPEGFWEQSGGLFGRAERSEPVFHAYSFRSRVEKEKNRLSSTRLWHVSERNDTVASR